MKLAYKILVVFAAIMAVAGMFVSPLMALEDEDIPTEGITQGEFAFWLIEAVGAEGKLPPAALADDATKFLSNLGFKPKEGWDTEEKLTQANLVEMLGLSEKEAKGKSWADLIKLLVSAVQETIEQLDATSIATIQPSISPSTSQRRGF